MSSTISAAAPGTFSIATAVYALGNPKVNGYGNAESILQFTDHLAIRGMAVTTGRLQGLIAVQGAVSIDTSGWSEIHNGYVLSGMFFGQTLGQQGTITKPVDVLPVVSGPTLGQDVLIDIPIAFGADGWYTASVFSICMSEQIFGSSFTTGAGNGWNADTRADQHRTRVRRAFRSGLLAARICSPEAFNVPALLTSVSLCAGHRSAFRAQVTSLTPTLVATLRAAWFPT